MTREREAERSEMNIPPKKRSRKPEYHRRSRIREIIQQHGYAFSLHPYKLMVSWQGVLVLAFRGFSEKARELKGALNESELLVRENPGSTWPKCTLGCLRDGKRLTPENLARLTEVCERYNRSVFGGDVQDFHASFSENPQAMLPALMSFRVKSLHLTTYECRSHELVLAEEEFPLKDFVADSLSDEASARAESLRQESIDPEEKANVDRIYSETLDRKKYWFFASKDGHRETHYREPKIGMSLVAWVQERNFLSHVSLRDSPLPSLLFGSHPDHLAARISLSLSLSLSISLIPTTKTKSPCPSPGTRASRSSGRTPLIPSRNFALRLRRPYRTCTPSSTKTRCISRCEQSLKVLFSFYTMNLRER